MAITAEQFATASLRGQSYQQEYGADSVRYNANTDRIIVELRSGYVISVAPSEVQDLGEAPKEALSKVVVSESRLGLHFPTLDIDLSIPDLFHGVTGNQRWMKQLGRAPKIVIKRRG